jgi:hypothetical protein
MLGVGYVDDAEEADQAGDFIALANCVDGAYERHGDIGDAWAWARPIMKHVEGGGSCTEYATQDLLDIVFLCCRGERFNDGLIRSAEAVLREMVGEVVRRVRSSTPPVFVVENGNDGPRDSCN